MEQPDAQALLLALDAQEAPAAVLVDGAVVLENRTAQALGDLPALAARAEQAPLLVDGPGGRALELRATRAGASLVLLGRDVEDREEARRLLRRSEELLDIGVHELRNPLHVVGMICNLLQTRASRGDALDPATLDRLIGQFERMRRLIDQLLDLSRVREDRLEIVLGPADLAAVVREELSRVPANRARDLRVEVVESAPVRADERGRLGEVVHQLLDNAVHFTDGGTSIEVRLAADGADWLLVVADHGPGIAPEYRPHLFLREGPAPKSHQRLGVGLYIAHRVMQLHNGSLRFSPTEPHGATFELRVPRHPS